MGCTPLARRAGTEPVWTEREAYLMGTMLRARVQAPTASAGIAATERVFEAVRELEKLLSTWIADSQIARINSGAPGESIPAGPELFALLAEVEPWVRATNGAFDPAVGALVDAWDLRRAGRRPTSDELGRAVRTSGWSAFRLEPEAGAVTRLRGGTWIDSGGFGKGAAMRAAERVLREDGIEAALLDFGGQILALGAPDRSGAWDVQVAHPQRRTEPASLLRVRNRSVATTAQSERFVEVDGSRYGHVLDPRTGHPVPAWGSATVVAQDAMVADILSTALFVLGPERAARWAADWPEIGVLLLRSVDGEVRPTWNRAMEPWLTNANTKPDGES